jgi:hypothetical protein
MWFKPHAHAGGYFRVSLVAASNWVWVIICILSLTVRTHWSSSSHRKYVVQNFALVRGIDRISPPMAKILTNASQHA